MIQIRGMVKSFGPRAALDGVDLSVGAGEFVTLVGPNGAGKTTLLRVLATLARPTSGTIHIAGLDSVRAGSEVRRRIGFLSHRTLLYEDLTAEQNLRFFARIYDVAGDVERIHGLLERVGLAARRNDMVRTFSRGMQQRLSVARAVLHRPSVLLMDEPYTGLDPQAAQSLTDLLTELAGDGCAILLTTHDLVRGLQVGRRVVLLAQGRVVHDALRTDVDPAAFPDLYLRLTA
ncbi:MAG: heme ABC exporter ATP-binding protein CcmA [Anaerolineae bacterium]|nr:heme ABC exporter ATP-binding protein CcmA [Anaerolineae bacterium]